MRNISRQATGVAEVRIAGVEARVISTHLVEALRLCRERKIQDLQELFPHNVPSPPT
jgi:hypothetical protein